MWATPDSERRVVPPRKPLGDVTTQANNTPGPRGARPASSGTENQPPAASGRTSEASGASGRSAWFVRQKEFVGPWRLGKSLGKGATGRVRAAKHRVTGQGVAVKIVGKQVGQDATSASMMSLQDRVAAARGGREMPVGIEREIAIMALLRHPHVVMLYDVWEDRGEM